MRHLAKTERPGDHHYHQQQGDDDDDDVEEEHEQEHEEVAVDLESDLLVLEFHGYNISPSPLPSSLTLPSKQQCTIPPVPDLDFSMVLLS